MIWKSGVPLQPCTTNPQILVSSRRISSGGLWNEHVHGGIGSGNHSGEDRPSFFCDLVTVALLNLLNEAVVAKQMELAADGRREAGIRVVSEIKNAPGELAEARRMVDSDFPPGESAR
jgi:hypothetical protein